MSRSKRAWLLALALGGGGMIGRAQPLVSPPAPEVVLSTRFVTPLTYEAALERLASYYDDQVGRKLLVAFPEIAPHCHFEVWFDVVGPFQPTDRKSGVESFNLNFAEPKYSFHSSFNYPHVGASFFSCPRL